MNSQDPRLDTGRSFLVVGKDVPRTDAIPKVTGTAAYVADLQFPGMLHAAVLRSPHPHARIVSIDTSAAAVGSSRVDLQACKLEYSIVSPK